METQNYSTIPPPPQQLPSPNKVTVAVPSSRRLPPPCWSHDETAALIDAYRKKWYSLRRGNLRANHWQEVADDVFTRCPVDPPKTAVQCRHKMEKLRKRYRTEIQRAAPYGGVRSHRYCSSWVHFKRMDDMEKGPNNNDNVGSSDDENNVDDYRQNSVKLSNLYGNNNVVSSTMNRSSSYQGVVSNGGGGFRIRIPGMPGIAAPTAATLPMAKPYTNSRVEDIGVENPNSYYGSSSKMFRADTMGKRVVGEGGVGGVGEKKKGDSMGEIVAAIKVLGDGFVRTERMKMDMARELEERRMEMEMNKTEMILESQQRIVEAFAQALSEKKHKKAKRMPTPEC